MCYFVYCVCYDVRLSHLNKDYLLTYLLTYLDNNSVDMCLANS